MTLVYSVTYKCPKCGEITTSTTYFSSATKRQFVLSEGIMRIAIRKGEIFNQCEHCRAKDKMELIGAQSTEREKPDQ